MSQREELEALTSDELRRRARDAGHVGTSKMRKAELIDLLLQPAPAAKQQPTQAPTATTGPSLLPRLARMLGTAGMAISLVLMAASPLFGWLAGRSLRRQGTALASTATSLAETARSSRRGLSQSADTLEAVVDGLQVVEGGLARMDPLLETVGGLLAEELPTTIETTRAALSAAESGAAAMDSVLRGLSLLGLNYNPSQPLPDSLAQTAGSLEPLPQSLRQVDSDLQASRTDVQGVAAEIEQVQSELDGLAVELRQAADSLEGYAGQLQASAERLEQLAALSWLMGIAVMLLLALVGAWSYVLHWSMRQSASVHLQATETGAVRGG